MSASVDGLIEEMAERQHGVVARHQLLMEGVPDRILDARIRSGRLRRLHRGVYQVGPVHAARSREMAAVLACGPTAVISFASAARTLEVPVPGQVSGPIDLSVPSQVARTRSGVRVHRVISLPPSDVLRVEGIPVTNAARTLVDLSRVLLVRDLEQAVAFALRERKTNTTGLEACALRFRGRPGVAMLLAILNSDSDPAFTYSEAEVRFLELLEGTGIAAPRTNVWVGGFLVDFYWPDEKVIVEVDGFEYHGSRGSYHRDRARDRKLAAEGYQVIRVTWPEIVDEGPAVLVSLARALALRSR